MYKLTKHSIKQAKSRLGWNELTLQRMIPKIMSYGIKHNQTKGSLITSINLHTLKRE